MQYDALDIETQAGTRKKPMALELTILVGTMTGTAQLVAQELELTLDDGEIRVRTVMMDGLTVRTRISPSSRSEEHTSELQSLRHLVCRLLLEKKKTSKLLHTARTRVRFRNHGCHRH